MTEHIGKYMTAEKLPPEKGRKTCIWDVVGRSGVQWLGVIKWYAPWRKYCFFPANDTLFDIQCCAQLSKFLSKHADTRNA